jgi:outer membrane protein assembly factor BamB
VRRLTLLVMLFGLIAPARALATTITSFTPATGSVDKLVTITGTGFSGATAVTIAGTTAAFSVVSDTTVTAHVPYGATFGPVTVASPSGAATSTTSFKVRPKVASFAPLGGPVGSSVALYGSGFTGATEVKFNTAPAVFTVVSYSQIVATVPGGATTGKLSVTGPGGTGASGSSFTVSAGPFASAAPKTGPPTTSATVSGNAFGPYEPVDVYFDTTDLALVTASASGSWSATIAVPSSAVPGAHAITAVGRSSGLSAQTTFAVRTNWPQLAFSSLHRGRNPYENVLGTSTVAGLDLDWTAAATDSIWAQPAIVNGIVYSGSTDHDVYAFRETTGALVWSATTGGGIYATPAVANNVVYEAADKLYAYNAATGAPLWNAVPGGPMGTPVVAGGVVYIGSWDHSFYAMDAAAGAVLWSFPTTNYVNASAAVANGTVYIGTHDGTGTVYALDATTGAVRWTRQVAGGGYIQSPLSFANGLVYTGSGTGLWALSATSGAIVWSATAGGQVDAVPAFANGVLYYSDFSRLRAVAATTGAPIWSQSLPCQCSSATVANGVVYVGAVDGVHAFDAASGAELWSASSGDTLAAPTIADGSVYVGSFDDHLYAFDLPAGLRPLAPPRPDPASLVPNPLLTPQH